MLAEVDAGAHPKELSAISDVDERATVFFPLFHELEEVHEVRRLSLDVVVPDAKRDDAPREGQEPLEVVTAGDPLIEGSDVPELHPADLVASETLLVHVVPALNQGDGRREGRRLTVFHLLDLLDEPGVQLDVEDARLDGVGDLLELRGLGAHRNELSAHPLRKFEMLLLDGLEDGRQLFFLRLDERALVVAIALSRKRRRERLGL